MDINIYENSKDDFDNNVSCYIMNVDEKVNRPNKRLINPKVFFLHYRLTTFQTIAIQD